MDTIYDILKAEHDQVSDLLQQASRDGLKVTFFKIKLKADPHMMGEEKFFYPVLEGMDERNENWTAKISELKQSIERHIEEEESELFEKARNVLSQERAEEIAQQYIEFKRSYMNRIETT
jgi:iron-sulfur cluster repair protein YtfE (RIC family)